VLTFDQGGMMATGALAGVGEESLLLGKNSPELGKMTESMSDSRDRPITV
jgi:hypothetical protein